jgi:hypothetical protein
MRCQRAAFAIRRLAGHCHGCSQRRCWWGAGGASSVLGVWVFPAGGAGQGFFPDACAGLCPWVCGRVSRGRSPVGQCFVMLLALASLITAVRRGAVCALREGHCLIHGCAPMAAWPRRLAFQVANRQVHGSTPVAGRDRRVLGSFLRTSARSTIDGLYRQRFIHALGGMLWSPRAKRLHAQLATAVKLNSGV